MPRLALALPVVALVASGCMSIPARYRQPLRVYRPGVDRVGVGTFERTEFVQTGELWGTVGGPRHFGTVSGWSGDYRTFDDATTMRWFLEETGCARRVDETRDAPLRVEGEAHAAEAHGAVEWTVAVVEAITLLPLVGLTAPGRTEGMAVARLYRDGELVGRIASSARLRYWTTLYTARRDAADAVSLARKMALRELADQVAAELCQGSGASLE